MTRDQWEAICLHLDLAFRGEWDDDRADAYATFLADLDAEQVMAALHVLALGGQTFTPSVGEILGVIDQAHGPPSFDRAWQAVTRALMRLGASDNIAAAERALSGHHPLILDWAQSYGWMRLAREQVNDPDHGGAVMHRLGRSYAEHVADRRLHERAERRGLPGAAHRQLGGGPNG